MVGTVVDEDGKPIVGAKIRAHIKEYDEEFTATNKRGRHLFEDGLLSGSP